MAPQRSGFTLIELLVVIAIIGILATLVITQLSGSRINARDARGKSDITEGGKAIETFKTGEGDEAIISNAPAGSSNPDLSTGSNSLADIFTGTPSASGLTYGAQLNATPSSTYTYSYLVPSTPASGSRKLLTDSPAYVISTNLQGGQGGYFAIQNGQVRESSNDPGQSSIVGRIIQSCPQPTPTPTPSVTPDPSIPVVMQHITCQQPAFISYHFVVKSADGSSVIADVTPDNSGHYQIPLTAGTYLLDPNLGGYSGSLRDPDRGAYPETLTVQPGTPLTANVN